MSQNPQSLFLPVLLAALLGVASAKASRAAQPGLTSASLAPCAFAASELQSLFGLEVAISERSDMTIPRGRDIGCIYTFRQSSLEVQIRQTWDDARPQAAGAEAEKGASLVPGDADRASFKAQDSDRPGARSEFAYVRGKVQVRIVVSGGRFTSREVLERLLRLRRVP